jgi:maleylpyruvate isomerase
MGGGTIVTDAVAAELAAVASSTERLLATVGGLDDRGARARSLLPGWTVGHVLTHVARNADGMRQMFDGAARDEVVDMYPHGPEGRAADIQAGAGRPAAALIDDVRTSAAALADSCDAMPAEAWDRLVRPTSGERPARTMVASRRREVEFHHVDLGLRYAPPDWPPGWVTPELERTVGELRDRLPKGTALRLVTADTGGVWEIGDGPASLSVSGRSPWVLAWLAGRPVPTSALHAPAGLPPLGAWR